MVLALSISPNGRPFIGHDAEGGTAADAAARGAKRIIDAFAESPWRGILHLATAALQAALPPDLAFARDFAREYLTRLCHTPGLADAAVPAAGATPPPLAPVPPPAPEELAATALGAPPMRGLEYLSADGLAS